ncbi:MAG: amidohydrolase family protein [Actinobacteria bacterium]|nr:amidohydrolase family protein [Actinomycetota bacterium]
MTTTAPGALDLHACLAPGIELVYERGTPESRTQWLDVERQLVLARPRTGAGDWTAPYLSLEHERDVRLLPRNGAGPAGAPEAGILQDNARGRLRALDAAGVAVQLLSPAGSIDAAAALPANLAVGLFGGYNQYALAYCAADPSRLKAAIQVHGGEPIWSAQEIRALAGEPAVAAVSVCLPVKIAPDSAAFAPLWEALEQTGLPLLFRPGFGARAWTPERTLGYLALTGLLERHASVRIAIAGSGAGWLAAWGRRAREMPGEAAAVRALEQGSVVATASDREDAAAIERVVAQLGDACLAWGSGFPLAGAAEGPPLAGLDDRLRERLLATNPSRFLGLG